MMRSQPAIGPIVDIPKYVSFVRRILSTRSHRFARGRAPHNKETACLAQCGAAPSNSAW